MKDQNQDPKESGSESLIADDEIGYVRRILKHTARFSYIKPTTTKAYSEMSFQEFKQRYPYYSNRVDTRNKNKTQLYKNIE